MSEIRVKQYLQVKKSDPEFIKCVEALGQAAKKAGPLNEKTAQLVQLAAAAASRSEGAVHSHARRALEAGALQEEIRHTLILLTSTVGLPTVMAALSWADEVMSER